MIGDEIAVTGNELLPPWMDWMEVTAIDAFGDDVSFKVGSEYWTVYMTQEAARKYQDWDDQFWVAGHRAAL